MENQDIYLFVRVRGKVAGPFDFEKLVSLARRQQLSRMHEVSTDQMSWMRAGTSYPQIWEGWTMTAPIGQPEEETVVVNTGGNPDETGPVADPPQPTAELPLWHYTKGGEEQQPIPLDQLKHLFLLGELTANEDVWTEGMSEWRKAGDVPALASVVAGKRPIPVGGDTSGGTQVPQQGMPTGQQPQIIIQTPGGAPAAPWPEVTTPEAASGNNGGLIAWGYVCAFLLPFVGGILGIVALAKGEVGNGIGIILLSLFFFFFWLAFWPAFQAAL